MNNPNDIFKMPKISVEATASDAFGEPQSEREYQLQKALTNLEYSVAPIVYFITPASLIKYFEEAKERWSPENSNNLNSNNEPVYIYKAIDKFIEQLGGKSSNRDQMKGVIHDIIKEFNKRIEEITKKLTNENYSKNCLIVFKSETRDFEETLTIYEMPQENFYLTNEYKYSKNNKVQ